MQAKLGFLPFIWTSHMFFLRITPRTSQYNPQILSSNHMQTHIWAQSAKFSKINLHTPLHLIILSKNSIKTKFFQPALISSPPLTKTAKTQQTHKSFLHKWNNSWSTNTKSLPKQKNFFREKKKKPSLFTLFFTLPLSQNSKMATLFSPPPNIQRAKLGFRTNKLLTLPSCTTNQTPNKLKEISAESLELVVWGRGVVFIS